MNYANAKLVLALCIVAIVAGSHADSERDSKLSPQERNAKSVDFAMIGRKRGDNVFTFRITNRGSENIQLESMFPDTYGFAPSPAWGWQFLKDGRWQDIHIKHGAMGFRYLLQPGKTIEVLTQLESYYAGELRLSPQTPIRLKNGAYFSTPFELGRRK
jgi:hypothetical protein